MKLLDLTMPTPEENLACDEALLDLAESGRAGEVLRFWESPAYFVVLGYANQVAAEVKQTACAARGIPILRRCTGGGTVLQGPGCLNYTLILRITDRGSTRNISSSNQFIMERNREAAVAGLPGSLRGSTIAVCGHTDLVFEGRKFSGNAQRRQRRFLLFHGTFLLNFNIERVSDCLLMPATQPEYRRGRDHTEFLANLPVSAARMKAALRSVWSADGVAEPPANETLKLLVQNRYSLPDWSLRR